MAQQKPKITLSKILTVMGCILAAGILIYIFVIRTWQSHTERQNFAKAEARLDELEKQIEAKVGKPDQIKKENSCGYTSQEIGKGRRSCKVSINILYKDSSSERSNNLTSSVKTLFSGELRDFLGRDGLKSFSANDGSQGNQIFYQDMASESGLDCGVEYLHPLYPNFLSDDFRPETKQNLEISLGCSGSALQEYFPLKD